MKTTLAFFTLMTIIALSLVPNVNGQYVCLRGANPIQITGSINAGDVQQAGRISRDGRPSSCSGDTATMENNDTLRRDTHQFTNPFNEIVCVKVEMDFTGCGGNQTQSVAYSNFNPANPAANVLGDSGFSTINKGAYSFTVGPNANFAVGVNEIEQNTGCPLYKLKVTYMRNCRQSGYDETNDGKADPTVYRVGSSSKWYTIDSETGNYLGRDFGTTGDRVTGANDYTGDGRTDLSVYRPSNGTFYYGTNQETPGTSYAAQQWGLTTDNQVPGDYDGDGKTDIAVRRASNGTFYVLRSSDNSVQTIQWGATNDHAVSGDFDGDLVTDFTVVRPTSGGYIWYILKSNYSYGFNEAVTWGLPTDIRVPADYDGDSITDIAVWRPSNGTFYVRRSSDKTLQTFQWGTEGDYVQPADYDGDGKHDFAVYRPSTGFWYIYSSATNTYKFVQWGQPNVDIPVTAQFRLQ
jgi:hypothetical protein